MGFELEKAEKELFAVYHTLYSNADIEMWFDWNKRLKDTMWTDMCYFLTRNGQKVGGAIITDEKIMHPFLIPPFTDRLAFWTNILRRSRRASVRGVLPDDLRTLCMFDYKPIVTKQVMCRPADRFEPKLPYGFACRAFDKAADASEAASVIVSAYTGGICDEINGSSDKNSVLEDIDYIMGVYAPKSFSHVITDTATNTIVAVCLSGVGGGYTHNYSEIAELCVLPEYRRMGLGEYMIKRVLTESFGTSPFVKLLVYVGNNAESLYNKMGFIAGPQFSNMISRNNIREKQ